MKRIVALVLGTGVVVLTSFLAINSASPRLVSPLVSSFVKTTPIPAANKYTLLSFMALAEREYKSEIKLGAATKKEDKYITYIFTFLSDGKTVSGMANIPKGKGPFPVIVLLRGYADRENYHIGLGTERSANFLAANGFLTLAPDFLGYGYSDWEDEDILMARFYRPVEVLNLIAAIGSLPQADTKRVGLWGHSNGGQIALSVLEITGKNYPTSLWAPVSLGFPESVLVYLGKEEEVGNPVKEKIDEFSKTNDPRKYSILEYLSRIKAPFIIHQGGADTLIKTEWTETLVEKLRSYGLQADYYFYKGENHNFNNFKKTGEELRKKDLLFFQKYLGN